MNKPDGSAVIIYPACPSCLVEKVTDDPSGDLLGRARAAVLEFAAAERTSGELARACQSRPGWPGRR